MMNACRGRVSPSSWIIPLIFLIFLSVYIYLCICPSVSVPVSHPPTTTSTTISLCSCFGFLSWSVSLGCPTRCGTFTPRVSLASDRMFFLFYEQMEQYGTYQGRYIQAGHAEEINVYEVPSVRVSSLHHYVIFIPCSSLLSWILSKSKYNAHFI